jgi:hypothetical protein
MVRLGSGCGDVPPPAPFDDHASKIRVVVAPRLVAARLQGIFFLLWSIPHHWAEQKENV